MIQRKKIVTVAPNPLWRIRLQLVTERRQSFFDWFQNAAYSPSDWFLFVDPWIRTNRSVNKVRFETHRKKELWPFCDRLYTCTDSVLVLPWSDANAEPLCQIALSETSVQHFLNSFSSFGWFEYKFSIILGQFSFAEYGNLNALIMCAQIECMALKKFALSVH